MGILSPIKPRGNHVVVITDLQVTCCPFVAETMAGVQTSVQTMVVVGAGTLTAHHHAKHLMSFPFPSTYNLDDLLTVKKTGTVSIHPLQRSQSGHRLTLDHMGEACSGGSWPGLLS